MDVFIKHLESLFTSTMKKTERNLLSELRLTEAILRSDINEITAKIDRIQQKNGK
jgi:hypothetical protein